MTDTHPAKFNKLVTLLKELFQLDQPDLDFGIYRIMHAKAGEVTQFLQRDLLPQVKEAFAQYQSADSAELKKKLGQMIAQLTEAGVDPETAPKVRELREQLKSAIDLGALENETYDHLYSFFRRYCSEGDFLAKRVYKPGVYAIPYEGEEVTLHWANKDQYYIKTSEYLRDYAFRLKPEAGEGEDPLRVHFKLVDAAEGEHGNVKAAEGKDRVFVLTAEDFIGIANGELEIRYEYRPAMLDDWSADQREGKKKPPAQKDLIAQTVAAVRRAASHSTLQSWLDELTRPHIKADGEPADYTRLEAHLRRYAARNTFDYFIHRDLGGFLRRELDFYIKNEVMHLDDVESETAAKVEQYLSKIKVIRRIAGKIIDFLAQLENFQKKLWLKKKFVVGSDWLVAISQVPEELLPEVCANAAQLEEWRALHSLHELPADLTRPAYSEPLTPEYLRAHPSLTVDTQYFDAAFVARLREAFGDIDEKADGVLVSSENFQALSLIQTRYREKVQCFYIDPPYNTGGDGFAYKDAYQHSSWLAMLDSRLVLTHDILADNGTFISNIDEHEYERLSLILDQYFNPENRIGSLVWKGATDNNPTRIAIEHEYLLCFAKDKTNVDEHWSTRTSQQKELMLDAYSRIRKSATSVDEIAEKFAEFAAENREELGDLYRYRRVDDVGPYAARRNMDNPGKRGYDYDVIHPVTKKPCARPYWGWRFPPKTMERMLVEDRIIFGDTEEKLPELKVYLSEVKFPLRSMFSLDARKGSNDLDRLFGARDIFKNPKPVELITYVVPFMTTRDALLADFFAGSGTTGHAIINMNREDAGSRKFVLIESGEHFDSVLVPRLKKVGFTPEWKDGKPVRAATAEEAERSPRLIKVLRLESYEDTLNNLTLSRSTHQQAALDFNAAQGADGLREQYLLRYQLDMESRSSASLLDIQAFSDPTAYKLLVKPPGSDESREVNVDLLETFNWLLGLTVQHIAAPRSFSAEFERDSEGRLRLKGRLKQSKSGLHPGPLPHAGKGEKQWWFRTVTGTTPEGRKTLVIWRKLTGDAEQDNLVLETWFRDKQAFSVRDTEFDLIYVNGDNTLENLRLPDESWKVRLTEEDFQRLMFEGTD
ncbi:site-specific DNA-methyltransferase [Rhodanobacter denitrificans]|uniref:site-specific DNA-methyltransferase n=1 Tax=Rhodanobacter denitrificans TaxID=666685 RepID=UPI0007A608B8|nr:site-specific DNA-methyltransferase [Rhodanobacter denitrificans]KZC19950.1 DNA methylase [Rhodanobacter denitrificans]UJM92417.1 site-specific DNA-methyltransferase [Rhodanobacter denitrificans]UJM95947.1 site-specific DNA-methyltransferase [Rhodanobacter denitrificans]UJN21222.1 site-specific DNA-methyltransferase [Rhodanobacter denitrificans]